MIVVTFALPAESSAFLRRLRNVTQEGSIRRGSLQFSGRQEHSAREVSVVHTGVGAAECERRLGPFLAQEQPCLLISSGFCGGTTDEISPGRIVIAANYSDAALAQKAQETATGAVTGKIFSANEVIDSATDRYKIRSEHDSIAIDMETENIARKCAEQNILILSLRVVSDTPAAPLPAPPSALFDLEAQRTKLSRLLPYLARDPTAVIRLVKFARQIASAREKLADALCAIIPVL